MRGWMYIWRRGGSFTETCFGEAAILDTENPKRFDDFRIFRTRNKSPGIVLHDRIVLFLHSLLPLFGIVRCHGFTIISRPFSVPFDYCPERFGNHASHTSLQTFGSYSSSEC